jgi:protein SCO1/2
VRAIALAGLLAATALAGDARALPLAAAVTESRGGAVVLPPVARGADLEEHLGARLPVDLAFTDEAGRATTLGAALGGQPALLTLAYYHCPSLCGLVLRGLARSLAEARAPLGDGVRAVTVSIDPEDRPADAKRAQGTALSDAGKPAAADAWPFLTGPADASRALADALGYRYAFDPATRQYAHPAVVFAITADGRVARVLYGATIPAADLRLALLEASEGRIGDVRDRVLATCFRFDPTSRRYALAIRAVFRGGGALVLASAAALAVVLARRERARRRRGR